MMRRNGFGVVSFSFCTRRVLLFAVLVTLLAACTLNTSDPAAPTATPLPSVESTETPLTVAWVQNGDLVAWRSRDPYPRRIAVGGVIRPILSPDGAWIAYVRGPGGDPRALWVIDAPGANERQLIDAQTLVPGDDTRRIGQVVWSPDAQVIYFNTSTGQGIDARPTDDLWRVDVRSGARENLLNDGEGGTISVSPDGTLLALAAAGDYAQPGEPVTAPGQIALFTPANYAYEVLIDYPAVATASQRRWYPAIRWLPDSASLRVAIPEPDLVYGTGTTALWSLPVEGEPQQLGTVDADFFGLPTFSADGAWITYIKRRATQSQPAITLLLAQADGSEPDRYEDGEIGTLSGATWLEGGARFTFTNGEAGDLWLGGPGGMPVRLPAEEISVLASTWADPATLVYLTGADDGIAIMSSAITASTPPQLITTLEDGPSAFDAVLPR